MRIQQRDDGFLSQPRYPLVVASIFMISTFLPYFVLLGYGIRPEQVVAYGLATAALIGIFGRSRLLNVPGRIIVMSFLVLLAVGTVRWVINHEETTLPPVGVLAGLDTLLLPIATIIATAFLVSKAPSFHGWLRSLASLFAVLMAINAVIAALQEFVDDPGPLRFFWSGGVQAPTVSVAEMSQALDYASFYGRNTGIFNQPAEAGLAYSIALICITFLSRLPMPSRIIISSLVMTGGLFTYSKVFIISCAITLAAAILLPLFVRQYWRIPIALAMSLCIGMLTMWPLGRLQVLWSQVDRLIPGQRFSAAIQSVTQHDQQAATNGAAVQFASTEDIGLPQAIWTFLNIATSGRIGVDGSLPQLVTDVITQNWLLGIGIQGVATAYDSAWVEAYVYAGLIGVIAIAAVLVTLTVAATKSHEVTSTLGIFLIIFTLAVASLGIGSVTANRISTQVWMILTVSLLVFRQSNCPQERGARMIGADAKRSRTIVTK